MFFGWRARDEHRRVKFGDFQVKVESDQTKYVEWVTERGSKTRTGESEFVPDRPINPKMFATGGQKCRVFAFEEYVRRRPVEMNSDDAPFYLAAKSKPVSHTWFKKQPLGVNSLGAFMKEMAQAAGLDGRYTNHSARRTMISTVRKEDVEPLNIIGLAGQRNLKSLDSYSEASEQQQKEMSHKISGLHHDTRTIAETHSKEPMRHPLQPTTVANARNSIQGMFAGATFNHCSFTFSGPSSAPSFNTCSTSSTACSSTALPTDKFNPSTCGQ